MTTYEDKSFNREIELGDKVFLTDFTITYRIESSKGDYYYPETRSVDQYKVFIDYIHAIDSETDIPVPVTNQDLINVLSEIRSLGLEL